MHPARTPAIDLDAIERVRFTFDGDDDVAVIHLNGPRPAVSEQADDGWYLRLADGEVVGMELHGLRLRFLSNPFYARVFRPALAELESSTGKSFEAGNLDAEGSTTELPSTTRLVILLVGQALAAYDASRKAEFAAAGDALLRVG